MTEQEYWQKVDFVCKHQPEHPLLRKITEAYNKINILYLNQVLKKMAETDSSPTLVRKPNKVKGKKLVETDDLTLRKLYIQKSSLFTERAKHSNQFHGCQTDKQRSDLSDHIQRIQKAIAATIQKIKFYEENGCLPEQDERYPIPKNPIDLAKKLNMIRARISQLKKEIETIAELPKKHPERIKLKEYEERLNYFTKYRGYVETAVKEASVY